MKRAPFIVVYLIAISGNISAFFLLGGMMGNQMDRHSNTMDAQREMMSACITEGGTCVRMAGMGGGVPRRTGRNGRNPLSQCVSIEFDPGCARQRSVCCYQVT